MRTLESRFHRRRDQLARLDVVEYAIQVERAIHIRRNLRRRRDLELSKWFKGHFRIFLEDYL